MAPPQVDLTKKQPLEDVAGWAEKVGTDKLPPLPPTAPADDVAVETSTTIGGRRLLGKKRCKILVIGMVIGALVAGAIVAGAFFAAHHKRHRHWKGHVEKGGHHGEERYEADGVKHVIHITRDENDNFYRLRAVLDYDRKLAAFKDCTKNRCYIDTLHESYERGCQRWMAYQHHARRPMLRPMRVVEPTIEHDVLQYFGGEEIARICGDAPASLVMEIPRPEHESGEHHPGGHHSGEHDSGEHDNPPPPMPATEEADYEIVYL